MHTPETAKELWCPMARVVQVGAIETSTAYNRVLSKTHVPIKLAAPVSEDDELGEGAKEFAATILKVETQLSSAARCLGTGCAMWRWVYTTESVPAEIEGPSGAIVRTFEQRVTKTSGYCGLAPLHGVEP